VILSLPDLLSRISDRLAEDVLPALTTAGWPASHVRSTLVLLAYAQSLLVNGPSFLVHEIAAIRVLLAEGKAVLEDNGFQQSLIDDIAEVTAESDLITISNLDDLQAIFSQHQALLADLIELGHSAPAAVWPQTLRTHIDCYLKDYAKREKVLFGEVIAMSPL